MTTVGAHVKVSGDSSDAVSAFNRAKTAAAGLDRKLGEVAKGAAMVGLGVIGMGAATEAVTRIIQLGRESISAYAEGNAEATGMIAGTGREIRALQSAIGGALVGGNNLRTMTGALNLTFQTFATEIAENEEGLQQLSEDGFRAALNAGLDLAKVLVGLAEGLTIAHTAVMSAVDGFTTLQQTVRAIEADIASKFTDSLADMTSTIADAADEALAFGEAFVGQQPAIQSVINSTRVLSSNQRTLGVELRETADIAEGRASAAAESLSGRYERMTGVLLALDSVFQAVQRTQDQVNEAMDDGAAAAAARSAAETERARVAAKIRLDQDLGLTRFHEKQQEIASRAVDRIYENMQRERDAIEKHGALKQEIQDRLNEKEDIAIEQREAAKALAEQRAQEKSAAVLAAIEAEKAAQIGYVDSSLGGLARLAAGNDKFTKAVNAATGARLAGQGVYQLNTGLGLIATGSYLQGALAVAQSAVTFAEAAKLGFSKGGGGRGGAQRQTSVNVNQTNVFSGGATEASNPGLVDRIREATRAGALEGAR